MAPTKNINMRMLVLLHDGKIWYGGVYQGKGWKQKQFADPAIDVLPEELLLWGDSLGASDVRVVLQEELEEFDVLNDTPALLPPAMLHQLLNEVASSRHDTDTDSVSPAMASKSQLNMGGSAQNLIGAIFQRALIQSYTETCSRLGMKFRGVTSFISVLLAYCQSIEMPMTQSLLYYGHKKSYLFGYSGNDTVVTYRDLPINSTSEDPELGRRAERRLRSYLHQSIVVITPEMLMDHMMMYIKTIDGAVDLDLRTIPTVRVELLALVASSSPYMLEDGIGFAVLPPPHKDDKYIGGLLALAMVLVVGATLGLMIFAKTREKNRLTELHRQIDAIEAAQKVAQDNFKQVQDNLNQLRDLHDNLQVATVKISGRFDTIMIALAKTTPRFSMITSITQEHGDVTLVKGETIWAEEVSGFAKAFQDVLKEANTTLRVVPLATTIHPSDPNKSIFSMEVK